MEFRILRTITRRLVLPMTLAGPASVASAGELVEFPCTLAPGQVIELSIETTQRQEGPDTAPRDLATEQSALVHVLEKNDVGFVMKWNDQQTGMADLEHVLPEDVPLEHLWPLLEEMQEMGLLFQTDELGTPLELLNLDEVRALNRKFGQGLMQALEETVPPEVRETMNDMLEQVLASDALASRSLEQASLLLMFTGGSFELGEDYGFEDAIDNPLGGDPFPAQVLFRIDSIDPDAGEAHVLYQQETDADAVLEYIVEMIRRLSEEDKAEEALAEIEGQEFGVFADAEFWIDLETGLPRAVEWKRTVSMGAALRVDTLAIEARLRK